MPACLISLNTLEEWIMRRFALITLLTVFVAPLAFTADDPPKDTPTAAKTREKLKKKITVNWKDVMFKEVLDDIKEATGGDQDGLKFQIDTKSGVSQTTKMAYKAKDKPADEVLTELLDKNRPTWGWYVISKEKDAYDGLVKIRVSPADVERGYGKLNKDSSSSGSSSK